MKRVLLSILIGFILVAVYLGILVIIYFSSASRSPYFAYLQIPVRLPTMIFYYFSPPTAEDYAPVLSIRKVLMAVVFFLVNILLYSIPPYLLLTLIARFRKPESTPNAPPSPSLF
jgi:hypothetical protein